MTKQSARRGIHGVWRWPQWRRAALLLGLVAAVGIVIGGCTLFPGPATGDNGAVKPLKVTGIIINSVTPTTVAPGGTVSIQYAISEDSSQALGVWVGLVSTAASWDEQDPNTNALSYVDTDDVPDNPGSRTTSVSIPVTATTGTYDVKVGARQPDANFTSNQWVWVTYATEITVSRGPDSDPPTVTISAPTAGCYKSADLPALAYTVVDTVDPAPTVTVTGWSEAEGTHTVTVTATDASGNSGSASVTYTVDDTAPVVTITAPTAGCYQNAPTGTFTVTETNSYTTEESGWSNAEGVHIYAVSATDCAGNVGSASVTYTADRTAPVVTITTPADGACYLVGTIVNAAFTVTDNLDLSPSVSSTTPNGAPIPTAVVGSYAFSVTATDCAGNSTTATSSYSVVSPAFQGIYPPYGSRPSIKRGSTFPIKWGWNACGALGDSSAATSIQLMIYRGTSSAGALVESTFPGKSGGPRYDPIAKQWIFNWQIPKSLTAGTYAIYIVGSGIWPGGGPFTVSVTR